MSFKPLSIFAILLLLAGSASAQGYASQAQQAASQAAQAIQERLPALSTPRPEEARISAGISPPSNITVFRDSFNLQVDPSSSVVLGIGFPPEAGVASVTLNVIPGQGRDSVSVVVERRSNAEAPVARPPPGAVHSYVEVTPNISTVGGRVQAKVDCAWLNSLGVQDAATRLRGYHLGAAGWEALPSAVMPDPAGCVLVQFDTQSFSWFAVAVEPQNTIPLTNIPVPKPSPGFEAVFALAGLVAVAYLISRRKR